MKRIILILSIATISFDVYSQKELVVIPNGHSLKIEKVILDEQQKYLYSAENEKIIMWNVSTGNQLYTFPLGDKDVKMAISHAGDKISFVRAGKLYCYSTITGKQLFGVEYSLYQTLYDIKTLCFTADDKHILLPDSQGIAEVDVNTGEHTYLANFTFNNHFFELYITNGGKDYLLIGEKDWQLRDANTGAIKTEQQFPERGYNHWYLPFSKMIANVVYINRVLSVVTFQSINDGAVVKKINNASQDIDIVLIPSITDNHFLISEGDYKNTKYKIYNTADFAVEKTLGNESSLGVFNYSSLANGTFIGDKNLIFATRYKDLFSTNTQTGLLIRQFKRTVASLGFDSFSSYEYNGQNGELNWVCDDSTLKQINLLTMKSERHVVIHTHLENVAISLGGDTLAVFPNNNGEKSYLKNIATNTMIKADSKIQSNIIDRVLYTFSNDGKFIFYPDKSRIVPDEKALYKWNLLTDAKTEIFRYDFADAISFSADKQLLSAVLNIKEKKYAQVINLVSGKVIFKQQFNDFNNEGKYFLHTSSDNKRLLLTTSDSLIIYDLATKQKELVASAAGIITAGAKTASNDLSMIAVGGVNGYLTVYKSDGVQLYEKLAHYSEIRNIFFSPDDQLIYTVSYDQTIKVWKAATGKLLGTLYLFSDGNDYVFVDEFGRFDGTPGGIKKLYYLKNRNEISLDLVYEKYYTPGLYQRLANGEKFEPMPSDDLKTAPKVKLAYAEKQRNLEVSDDIPSYQNTTGAAEITVTASAGDDSIDEIRLFQNGKVLNLATRNLIVADEKTSTATKKYSVSLLPGANEIRAVALNTQRTESQPDIINVIYNTVSSNNNTIVPVKKDNNIIIAEVDKNATLHLIVVGINAYKNSKMSLNYALADATSFRDEVEKDSKSVLGTTKTYFVTDADADKAGIIKALAAVQQAAQPQDVFIFYYAGHGVIAGNKEFYLVPNDVTDLKNVDAALKEHGIAAKELQQYAINIKAQKQLFILDACQSAAAFEDMLSSNGNQQKNIAVVARATGTHWMAASGAQQFANEFATLGHGAFTYVLLQALKGEAANNKMITVDGLKTYMQTGVPNLMKKYSGTQQIPASYGFGNDFPVEVVK